MFNLIEKYLFFFFLFAIPFQTRKVLWYSGWRFNEWTSISLYATDILLAVLLVLWIVNKFSIFNFQFSFKSQFLNLSIFKFHSPDLYLFLLLILSAISIKNSSSLVIGWFQWIKLAECLILYFYIKNYAIYKFGFTGSLFAIFYGGLFQGLIAIIQSAKQSSLGLSYFGESIFNVDINGVASFYDLYGDKILRSYGTTPHPNVLAAYLFLALFAYYFIWFYKKLRYDKLYLAVHFLTLWAFFLTFSRTAIFILGSNYMIRGCFLFTKFLKLKSKRVWQIIIYTGLVMLLFIIFYWPQVISRIQISGDEDAVRLRSFYNKESVDSISFFGTGMGDYVIDLAVKAPTLPHYLYQPVHNIYLLIYSEIGILGLTAFVLFLVFLIRDFVLRTMLKRFHHYSIIFLLSSYLFLGFFDHYLWTLQQGRLLFWFVLGLLTVNENDDIM